MKKNNNTGVKHYRQGDVLLVARNTPVDGKRINRKKPVRLALGEATGHHHSFNGGAAGFADDENAMLADMVKVEAKLAELTHQEHETIEVPKGDYDAYRQVEYTPEALRNVRD